MSLGEKYEFLTQKLMEAKRSSEVTKGWEITYFSWFLYKTYPPPKMPTSPIQRKGKNELEQKQQFHDFNELLNELKRQVFCATGVKQSNRRFVSL